MSVVDGKTTINGREYYAVQMPPSQALLLQLELTRIMGGALGKLMPVLRQGSQEDSASRMAAMSAAVAALFDSAPPEQVLTLITKVVNTVKVDGRRIEGLDTEFQGAYLADTYKVFFWALGLNFASFFGEKGLQGVWAKFTELAKKELANQVREADSPAKPPQT